MSVYCRKKGNEDEPKMFVKVRERERGGREEERGIPVTL